MEKDNELELAYGTEEQVQRRIIANIAKSNYLEKINRYETSIENKFYRAIRKYRKMKNGFVS